MNDEELRKLLQNSLAGRRAPPEVRERIVSALRPRRRLWIAAVSAGVAAAAAVVVAILLALPRPAKLNPTIERAIDLHVQIPRGMLGHGASSATPREITETVSQANGRDIEVPGLRDGGFTQLQAHCCQETGWAHVVYANSWLKVSCFILDLAQVDVFGGRRLSEPGIEAYAFARDRFSVVVVRESGLAKIWVADLRPENLATIAIDAEQKPNQLQTMVLSVPLKGSAKQMEAVLQSTPGVEDIRTDPSKQEAYVRFDRRRLTLDQIAAVLATSEIDAKPRDWERR